MRRALIQAASVLLAGSAALAPGAKEPAEGTTTCPKLSAEQCPAVLLVERVGKARRLDVGYFKNGKFVRKKILTTAQVEAAQLAPAVFLLNPNRYSRRKAHVVDLARGRMKRIGSGHLQLLGTSPKLRKALLMRHDRRKDARKTDFEFFELDFASFALTRRGKFGGSQLAPDGWRPRSARASPDLHRVAYITGGNNRYALTVLDLKSGSTTKAANGLSVEVPAISSYLPQPVFTWIDDHRVLFQDIKIERDPNKPRLIMGGDEEHRLKIVDVRTRKVVPLLTKKLPLLLDGGSLDTHPLTRTIIYRGEYEVVLAKKQLRKLKRPVPKESRPCLSPSGKSFAYRLRGPITPANRTPLCRTFVKTPAVKQPVKISEGLGQSSLPVGWVEEVKQTTSRPKPGH